MKRSALNFEFVGRGETSQLFLFSLSLLWCLFAVGVDVADLDLDFVERFCGFALCKPSERSLLLDCVFFGEFINILNILFGWFCELSPTRFRSQQLYFQVDAVPKTRWLRDGVCVQAAHNPPRRTKFTRGGKYRNEKKGSPRFNCRYHAF